jgi:hypothetical protein
MEEGGYLDGHRSPSDGRRTVGNEEQRTTIFLAEADRIAIRAIRERYSLSTDSDAIRMALRVVAASPGLEARSGGGPEKEDPDGTR